MTLLPLMAGDRNSSDITHSSFSLSIAMNLFFHFNINDFIFLQFLNEVGRLEMYNCIGTQWNDNNIPNQEIMNKNNDNTLYLCSTFRRTQRQR